MIRSIHISNFRGHHEVHLTDLKRINVFVGRNGSGKTSLLEGIFIAAGGSPEVAIRTRQWRGREGVFAGTPAHMYEAIWADTFKDPVKGKATITIEGDNSETRSVSIERIEPTTAVDISGKQSPANLGVKFTYTPPGGQPQVIIPEITNNQLLMGSSNSAYSVRFMPARMNASEPETAQEFSALRIAGNEKDFVNAFYSEFDFLSDLTVEAPYGSAAIYAKMGDGRRLPLTMISGGINHLAGLLVRIANNPKSILLVDEIENGIYFDRYGSMWKTIFELAKKNDVQIFASTHNLECLVALSDALKDSPDEVRFIRTTLMPDAKINIEQLSGKTLFGALSIGEVR